MSLSPDELNRVYWHSRRGMLELDLVLMPFAREHFPGLPEADQQRYLDLLACEDQDLFRWFLGKDSPEDEALRQIVKLVLERIRLD